MARNTFTKANLDFLKLVDLSSQIVFLKEKTPTEQKKGSLYIENSLFHTAASCMLLPQRLMAFQTALGKALPAGQGWQPIFSIGHWVRPQGMLGPVLCFPVQGRCGHTRENPNRLSKTRDWSILLIQKGWESWECSAWRRLREISPMCVNTLREATWRMEPGPLPWCPVTGVCPEAVCTHSYTDGALRTVGNTGRSSPGNWELSLLRDTQNPSGHTFGQVGLGCPAWTERWSLGGSFQFQPISNFAKTF